MRALKSVDMPAAQVDVDTKIQNAAGATISAEQWLQTHGWRDTINRMHSAKADEFLDGFNRFRARLDTDMRSAAAAEARRWRVVVVVVAVVGLGLGIAVGGAAL